MTSVTSMKEKVRGLEGVVTRATNREPDRLILLRRTALANIYYRAGVQLIKQDQYRQSREYFFRELQCHPLKIESWIYLFISIAGANISKPLIDLKRSLWKYLDELRKK
jgi:hypothetical protein